MKINQKFRNTLNKALKVVNSNNTNKFNEIPFGKIQEILREHGVQALDEENNPWSGILCGENSCAYFPIGTFTSEPERIQNCQLALTWYKFASGNFEIVCYVS